MINKQPKKDSIEEQLKYRTDFEKLILEISSNFINLKPDKIDDGICTALKKIAKFADADRSYIFLFHNKYQKMSNTHEWVARGAKKEKDHLQNLDINKFPWIINKIRRKETVNIEDVLLLPKEAKAEKKEFLRQDIKSLINLPMISKKNVIGFIGFDSVRHKSIWPSDIINLLDIVGDIFANTLESKRVEEAIRREKEFFETTINGLPGIFLQLGEKGKYIRWNKNLENVTGYSSEELLKMTPLDVTPKEEREIVGNSLKEVMRKGWFSGESTILTKSGKKIPYCFLGTRFMKNNLQYVMGMGIDITELKKVEAALKTSEDRFKTLFTNAPIALLEVDLSGVKKELDNIRKKRIKNVEFYLLRHKDYLLNLATKIKINNVNQEFLDLIEICDISTLKEDLKKILFAGNHKSFARQLSCMCKGETIFQDETLAKSTRGNKKNVILKLNIAPGFEKSWSKVLLSIVDITEQKRVEKERERLTSIVEGTTDFVGIVDENSQVVYINSAGQKMAGLAPGEDYLKYKIVDFHPDWAAKKILKEGIPKAIKTGVWRGETALINPDGEEFPVSQVIMTHKKPDGTIDFISTIVRDVTKQKKAEEKLRESKANLDEAQSIAKIGSWNWDIEHDKITWSDETYRLFGFEPGEFIPKYEDFLSRVDVNDRKKVSKAVNKSIQKKESYDVEFAIITQQGKKLFTHAQGKVHYANSKPLRMSGTIQNISEHKKAEETLRKSESKFRQLFENEPTYAYLITPKGKILNANKAALKTLGYKKSEIIGKTIAILYAPESYQKMKNLLKIWVKTGHFENEEMIIVTKKGGKRTVLLSVEAIRNEKGEILHSISLQKDITERKKAEQEVKEEQEFALTLLNGLREGFAVVDKAGNQIFVNDELVKITGFSKKELLKQRPPFKYWAEEGLRETEKVFKKALTGIEADYELTFKKKNGQRFFALVSPRQTKDPRGNPVFFTSVKDITARKKAEEALKQKDREIRRAYIKVFSAVTGGKLIIMAKEELKGELGKPITDLFTISSYKELAQSRSYLRKAIENKTPYIKQTDEVILAVDESLTNAVKHAGGGRFQVFEKDNTAQVLIADTGPGIDFGTLPKATLLSGFSTRQTLGAGFSIMLELSDRVLLASDPKGTQIVLENREEKANPFEKKLGVG